MRAYCEQCKYPATQCLCAAIAAQPLSADIVILQHPKERRHAKNTARIAQLCSAQVSIVDADSPQAMSLLATSVRQTSSALLYPCQDSQPIEQGRALSDMYQQWIFLDGSWKQAFALLQQHAFLQSLPAFHFDTPPPSAYQIRHTRVANSLSTLEAIAYCMQTIYGDNTDALLNAQEGLISRWQGPVSHRRN